MTETRSVTLSRPTWALVGVKLLHTAVWAFFVACILALPVAAWLRHFDWALGLILIVLVECGVIALNRGRCPLTDLASRWTTDRSPNFDIYLPTWLAEHNKSIFGTLFALILLFTLWRWLA